MTVSGAEILSNFEQVKDSISIVDINRLIDELFYCIIVEGFHPTEAEIINVQSFLLRDSVSPHHVHKLLKALTPVIQKDETNFASLLFLRNPLLVEKVESAIKENDSLPRQAR